MPRATMECPCVQKLIAAVTGFSVHCRVHGNHVLVCVSGIPIGIFDIRTSAEITLEAGHDAVRGQRELVLQYRIVRAAGLPGWLIGGLANWIAHHFVKHPVVHLQHDNVHIHLDRINVGTKPLTAVVHVTAFRVPDGAAACSLAFILKE